MYTNSTGFYSDTNNAHLYPNTGSSYSQWRLDGNRNGYGGIWDSYSSVNVAMYDSSGNGGVYREANGRWYFYHLVAHNCMGVNTSSTSSSYGMYVSGSIYSTGVITAASDERRKDNVVTIEKALDKVLSLRGVTFTWNDLEEDHEDYNKTQIGVIAQETIKVVPEVVTYAEDVDEYSVSYGNLTALLIEAMKEQNEVINTMRKEIEELKQRLEE
jgi:hypothetical protein